MNNIVEFSKRLKSQREVLGLTQAQLGEKIGVSAQTISAYEKNGFNGKGKLPTLDKAVSLADVLGVSLDFLCGVSAPDAGIKLESYADVYLYLTALTKYFYCSVGFKTIDLDEVEIVDFGNGDEEIISTKDVALLTIDNSIFADFFCKRNKMYKLYKDRVIQEDMYDSWLQGELEKLKQFPVGLIGPGDFDSD